MPYIIKFLWFIIKNLYPVSAILLLFILYMDYLYVFKHTLLEGVDEKGLVMGNLFTFSILFIYLFFKFFLLPKYNNKKVNGNSGDSTN